MDCKKEQNEQEKLRGRFNAEAEKLGEDGVKE